MTIPQFQKKILSWYKKNRRDLPWRNTKDPYRILVSEIMLQQTQVMRVIPKYTEFLKAFPTLEKLAKAPNRKLLKVWAGLGYWRRARHLKETAKIIVEAKKTVFSEPKDLETLPGIGPYTARAIACFAFGSAEAFLDTNIRRVYLHFFFPKKHDVSDKEILPIAQKATSNLCSSKKLMYPKITPKEWHYALFDYGATVLKDKKINKRSKHYSKQSKFAGSLRSFRTKVMRFLLDQQDQKATKSRLARLLKEAQSPYPAEKVLAALEKDSLIKKRRNSYSL